jgi:cob(I)alamin adenosyltransferase
LLCHHVLGILLRKTLADARKKDDLVFIFLHFGYNLYMSPIFTRMGDDGTTGQLGEGRLPKNHPRIEALGALDEASAALGLSRALSEAPLTKSILIDIQRDLYKLMTEISATPENANRFMKLDSSRIKWLESQAEIISEQVPLPAEFILSGDSVPGAALALSRTIVRRSERRVVELFKIGEIQNPLILQYLNRLSSVCFALELLENKFTGHKTTLAKK